MARLGDVCDILNGFAFKSEQYVEEGIRIIRIANVQKGFIEDSAPVFYPIDSKDAKKYSLEEDDMLISLTGNVGRVAKLSKEFLPAALNQRVACLRIKDGVKLDKAFLFNLLNSDYFEQRCIAASKGVAQKNMSTEWLKEYEIPMLSMEQQKAIAAILDKVTELIALRKAQLAKLDRLVKSRFIELFGDPVDNPKNYLVKSLQELIDMGYITYHLDGNHGGDYPRSEEFVDSGVPYIGANSIVNGKIDFSMAKFLTAERAGKLRKGIAQNDDVLFAHNATVGPTVVLKTTEPKVILSTSLTAYRCDKSRLLPNYLKAYMQSDGFVRQYSGEMKQTTRNQVPITAQKKYLFLVPPIVEQKQFAAFVEQTDKSKLAIQQSLDKLELLKKSLMQEYFG